MKYWHQEKDFSLAELAETEIALKTIVEKLLLSWESLFNQWNAYFTRKFGQQYISFDRYLKGNLKNATIGSKTANRKATNELLQLYLEMLKLPQNKNFLRPIYVVNKDNEFYVGTFDKKQNNVSEFPLRLSTFLEGPFPGINEEQIEQTWNERDMRWLSLLFFFEESRIRVANLKEEKRRNRKIDHRLQRRNKRNVLVLPLWSCFQNLNSQKNVFVLPLWRRSYHRDLGTWRKRKVRGSLYPPWVN